MNKTTLLICLFIVTTAASLHAQDLFVGGGVGPAGDLPGYIVDIAPDGSQSTFATLPIPDYIVALAFNNSGDLFAADGLGNIYEYAPDGTQTTFASGLSSSYQGLAFNSADDLFEADNGSGNIYEFAPDGTRTKFATGLFFTSQALAFNSAGSLFVAESGGFIPGFPGTRIGAGIYEFTPNGTQRMFATGLSYPDGLAFNNAGDLFVADNGNGLIGSGNIYEYAPDGTRTTFSSGLTDLGGLAFNSAGDLFALVSGNIYEYALDGTRTMFASASIVLNSSFALAFQPIPEPSALSFILLGTALCFYVRRTQQRQQLMREIFPPSA